MSLYQSRVLAGSVKLQYPPRSCDKPISNYFVISRRCLPPIKLER